MKSNTSIYSDLLKSIKTVDELNQFSSEIDNLLSALFKTQEKFFLLALEKIGIENSQNLKEAFAKNSIDLKNKELIKDFLEKLKAELGKQKSLKIIIAFEPSAQTVEHIHNWTEANLGPGFVLDLSFDQTFLGGAIVAFNGEYRDLTVKKMLLQIFETKRKEILSYSNK